MFLKATHEYRLLRIGGMIIRRCGTGCCPPCPPDPPKPKKELPPCQPTCKPGTPAPKPCPPPPTNYDCPHDSMWPPPEPNKRAFQPEDDDFDPGKSAKMWRNIFILGAPFVIGLSIWTLVINHHHPKRPPFIAYPYLRLRPRKWPWGDGNHSFLHNPKINALPDGYETEDDEDSEDD